MRILALGVVLAGGFGTQLVAGSDRYQLPPGCTAFLTVQTKDCHVEHHWTCRGDVDGSQWILSMAESGPEFLQQVDREFVWLQSFSPQSGLTRVLKRPAQDLNSLTKLLKTGADDYDFTLQVLRDGTQISEEHVVGRDWLTGEKRMIDGETLLVVKYSYEEQSSTETIPVRSSGTQFVSPRFRNFFLGTGRDQDGTDVFDYDGTPIQFVEPGEPGFLSVKPRYGCTQILSGLDQPLTTDKEINDDI